MCFIRSAALEEVRSELNERVVRWARLELLLGLEPGSMAQNPGLHELRAQIPKIALTATQLQGLFANCLY